MPYTIAQIAEANKVSKTHVRKLLKERGLLDDHTTTVGGRGTVMVDDEATQIVSHYIAMGRGMAEPSTDSIGALTTTDTTSESTATSASASDTASDSAGDSLGDALSGNSADLIKLYDERIADLKQQIDMLRADRDAQVAALREDVREAHEQIAAQRAEFASTIKALPSGDQLADAEARGHADEREKIAAMGMFARWRYLRG